VPCSPINTYPEVLQDPQVEHMGWVQQIELPNGVNTQTFGPVLRINDTAQSVTRRPPALGEHTEEVLGQLAASGEA